MYMDKAETFYRLFPGSLRELLAAGGFCYDDLREIRLRVGQPVLVRCGLKESTLYCRNSAVPYVIGQKELTELINYICDYSIYAYEEEIRQGFITVTGGHRIGIGGCVAMEGASVRTFRYITCVSIRVAHEITGVADHILPYLFHHQRVRNTLILSSPGCGKTTLLRDVVRQISDSGQTVGVVDERSEIGGCYMGIPQNDIGRRTDIIDCCAKAQGIMMLIRSMAPDVIAVDEIGSREDAAAIGMALHSGCRLIATVHGYNIDDIAGKDAIQNLIREKALERFVILEGRALENRSMKVLDMDYRCIYQSEGVSDV